LRSETLDLVAQLAAVESELGRRGGITTPHQKGVERL
jgi:hypothetical protein